MTADEFRQQVKINAGERPLRCVEAALVWHAHREKPNTPAAVRECLDYADFLAGQAEWLTPGAEPIRASHSSTVQLLEKQLLDTIAESVQRMRLAIFGSPHARFTPEQYGEAVAWVEGVAGLARRGRTLEEWGRGEERKRSEVLEEEIHARLAELAQIYGAEGYRWRCAPLEIRYVHPAVTYSTRVLAARTDDPLFPLVKGVAQISAATGYREPALVAYVLCDIPPILPRLLWGHEERSGLELPDGTRLDRQTATITLNDFFVTVREVERTVERIRKEFGEKPENAALRIILQRLGGVPPKPPLSFWREVARQWLAVGMKIRGGRPSASDLDSAAKALSKRFRNLLPQAQREALRQPWRSLRQV